MEIQKRIEKKYPCDDEFDPEALAAWHKRRGGIETIIYKGVRYGWIGNRGSLLYAPDGMKRAFVCCVEVHGEDAAKTWAWLQGWIVGQSTYYIERFKEELNGADHNVSGSEGAPLHSAGDRARRPSRESVDDSDSELPF